MRSVVYRYDDLRALVAALDGANGQGLPLPSNETVRDGEWVLAIFELGQSSRATAAAGRGAWLDIGLALVFERRDWERLRTFASAGETTLHPFNLVRRAEPDTQETLDDGDDERTLDSSVDDEVETPRRHVPTGRPPPEPKPRVLVVDDDPDLRDVLGAMLEAVGLDVAVVSSGEEALDRVRLAVPDLLLLDWNLPGMSGLDLCRTIRHEPPLAQLPVLFLTAHSSTQDMVEAFSAGADDYVVKPFRAAELGARIFGLLRRARMSRR